MRTIDSVKIRDTVARLCLKANFELRPDILRALKRALGTETRARPRRILASLIENAAIAKRDRIALCQDTGMVTVFIGLGQDVAVTGGDLTQAIQDGVAKAYRQGYLRKSIVGDPFVRKNTGTNTPAVVAVDIVRGNRVRLVVSPKGFGSENKSAITMLRPTAGIDEVAALVLDVVRRAGPDACPPLILGIGIGGTFDKAASLAKRALLVPLDRRNPKRRLARLERSLLAKINRLGIGPMGLGGKTTALGLHILDYPTHIAGLPVAVNVSCHATRSAEALI